MYSTYVGIWVGMCSVRGTYMYLYISVAYSTSSPGDGVIYIYIYIYTAIILVTLLRTINMARHTVLRSTSCLFSSSSSCYIARPFLIHRFETSIHTYPVHMLCTYTPYSVHTYLDTEYSVDISTAELEKKKRHPPNCNPPNWCRSSMGKTET